MTKQQQNGVYADHPFRLLPTPIFELEDESKATYLHHLATEMVHVHNIILRGLNSIYLQATNITTADANSFTNFMAQWLVTVHTHHGGEETIFFPGIERLTGEKGVMDTNLEQHHAFEKGLNIFEEYVHACLVGNETYSGARVVQLIDEFGPILATHLTEEIPTLLALERFGEKLDKIDEVVAQAAKEGMGKTGFFTGLPFLCVTIDRHYEGDRWLSAFPPGPGQTVLAVARQTAYWVHRDWWKFGPCDRYGNMQPLYACAVKGEQN
ncbi:hemerythrin HHE cation binding domain-containing protein [Sarocladium implicatum]|nr:hemerythrin HHE cation binding domain-containing protein [Sarocladium implicatum]